MTKAPGNPTVLRRLAGVLTVINLLLAVTFFPLVPLLGWLNYGVAGWATAWIPDVVMLLVLPVAYSLYWHYGFLIAGVPLVLALWLWRRGGGQEARTWAVLNAATIVV
jgi:hypothetical protein